MILLLAFLLAAAESVPAPEEISPRTRFDALVDEIGALREDLERLDRAERGLLSEREALEVRSAMLSRQVESLHLQREDALRELDATRFGLIGLGREARRREEDLAQQLRQVYVLGRERELGLVLALDRPVDLMRGLAYLDLLARRESAALTGLRQARSEAEALERSLAAQTEALETMEAQQREKVFELEEVRGRQSELLRSIGVDRQAHQRAIDELTRAAEALEAAIVASLAGAPETPREAPVPVLDLERLKGTISWPADGPVTVPFGDIRNAKFGTLTPHPGLDIQTRPRAPIRAVLGGRVVFARRFSGYGNAVLLDHGEGFMSVYARAAVLQVAEGQEVLTGQILGVGPEAGPDEEAPSVYFEFRRDGRAVDPSDWLKRNPAQR